MAQVKQTLDILAVSMKDQSADVENIRGSGATTNTLEYFGENVEDDWLSAPLFDLYDLVENINADPNTVFSAAIETNAGNAMSAVDALVVYSFGGSAYTDFTINQNGITIFFPDGDRSYQSGIMWSQQYWYNSIDTVSEFGAAYPYGKLAWCINDETGSAADQTGVVENWFEMLDSWFDTVNDGTGGLNKYQW